MHLFDNLSYRCIRCGVCLDDAASWLCTGSTEVNATPADKSKAP